MANAFRIGVTGTRGFPDIQGGVENHCEHLYTHLAEKGHEIIVFTRMPYVTYPESVYKGVKLVSLKCMRHKYIETIIHTFKSIIAAHKMNIKVLHIHSIGASFFAPLARVLGMKVVVTHHGQDYKREKWNAFAKLILRICEVIGMTFANEIIVITEEIAQHVRMHFKRESTVIPNGVMMPSLTVDNDKKVLKEYGIQEKKYILIVGRFVPEKAFDVLMDAFNMADTKNWKLVVVGSADHRDRYSALLEKKASHNKNIIMTGFLRGNKLHELYKHAGFFVLPSFYEGLPIVLLEAMSFGLSCIVSDIPSNRNILLSEERYFAPGDAYVLTEKIEEFIEKDWSEEEKAHQLSYIAQNYNWERIADQTLNVYQRLFEAYEYPQVAEKSLSDSKLRIAVLGTRGFPDVQGGVEVHCQHLYPLLVEKGCEVIVFTRKRYVNTALTSYRGVRFICLTCPKSKYFEAFVHTLKGLLIARKLKPDIIHIHAIGPSFFSPFAKFLGMKVVVTHHGENYKHMKWGFVGKQALRLCEMIGMKYADSAIAISENIACAIYSKFNRTAKVIPNGVTVPPLNFKTGNNSKLKEIGIKKGEYILNVGRFVPEKGIDVLMNAFNKAEVNGWKLVIVGCADHVDDYSIGIEKKANLNKKIILTGFLSGEPLQEIYSNAGIFVLPSYYEGLPLVLLEAMSYGLSCIVSDIPGNRIVSLSEDRYFKVGNVDMLKEKIEEFIDKPWQDEDREKIRSMVAKRYNWETISNNVLKVYKDTLLMER